MKSIAIRMLTRWNLIIAVLIAIVISIYINYERIIDPYLMGSIDSRSLYFIYGFVDKTILTMICLFRPSLRIHTFTLAVSL